MDWLLNGTGEVPVLEIKNQKRTISSNADQIQMEMFSFLCEEGKRGLLEDVERKGVDIVVYFLDEDNRGRSRSKGKNALQPARPGPGSGSEYTGEKRS
ncbi:hypothetical protein [Cedecea sp. NFIX57]|uniref:hypothetical protein n=1 Tax=Cedecea sp. NFIX57 TaxID=1566286 RepID=UPI000A0E42F3|nr:hypothetical protein [Cedecea sp. NFIX57]SMG61582.1 hypothetical protein SAMN03159353_104916 [Cedecea sp. NFIX57]